MIPLGLRAVTAPLLDREVNLSVRGMPRSPLDLRANPAHSQGTEVNLCARHAALLERAMEPEMSVIWLARVV